MRTPPLWGTRKVYEKVVRMLQEHNNPNVDTVGMMYGTAKRRSHGHEEAVRVLLERCDIGPNMDDTVS